MDSAKTNLFARELAMESDDDGTQTMLDKVSEFFVIERASTSHLPEPCESVSTSWVQCTGSRAEDFKFLCLCKGCLRSFGSKTELSEHLDEHYRHEFAGVLDGDFCCPVLGCEMTVASSQHMFRHLRAHLYHAEKQRVGLETYRKLFPDLKSCGFERTTHMQFDGETWRCCWKSCGEAIDDLDDFMLHVLGHADRVDAGDKGFPCEWVSDGEHQCQQTFTQRSGLRVHIKVHSGDRACACPFCGSFFTNNTKLSDHVLRRREDNAPLTCAWCLKKFSTNRLLKLHCRKHVKSVKCAYCAVVMDCASAVAKHMRLVHAKIRTEQCSECGLSFGLKTDLQKHYSAIHEREPQFPCSFCPMKFRWEKQLRGHEKTHSDNYIADPYLCHKCPMKYKSGSSLSRHLVSVHSLPIPNGFNRFQYKKCHDGFYRLQTSRCISQNVVEAAKLDVNESG